MITKEEMEIMDAIIVHHRYDEKAAYNIAYDYIQARRKFLEETNNGIDPINGKGVAASYRLN